MKTLTIKIAKTLIGKKVKFSAPVGLGNYPLSGVAIIKSVNSNNRNPIETIDIEGEGLNFSYSEWFGMSVFSESNALSLGDDDRLVQFELLN